MPGRWDVGWRPSSRFLIGAGNAAGPMLKRWRLIQTPSFGVYVHFIYREDADPTPHDHPWRFTSLVLRGGYTEAYQADPRGSSQPVARTYRRWSAHTFPLQAAHRITAVTPGTVTLVLVGRKVRVWGFYSGTDWTPWYNAQALRPTEGSVSTGKVPV